MWLVDPKTKEKSVTLTAFAVGFVVATLKLLVAGLTVGSVKMTGFSGGDYAAVVGALGAVYTLRRNMTIGGGSD